MTQINQFMQESFIANLPLPTPLNWVNTEVVYIMFPWRTSAAYCSLKRGRVLKKIRDIWCVVE
uniref:Uncharacterized protein n=1 Tax=Rhizophora mucronata TaxID=61149 RepID=A0A2P2NLE7_RHIMU